MTLDTIEEDEMKGRLKGRKIMRENIFFYLNFKDCHNLRQTV